MNTNRHEWEGHGFHGFSRIESVLIREIRVSHLFGQIRVYSCSFVVFKT